MLCRLFNNKAPSSFCQSKLRREESLRKHRIFNPRFLRMGINTEALAAQVAEKKCREDAEREAEKAQGNFPTFTPADLAYARHHSALRFKIIAHITALVARAT